MAYFSLGDQFPLPAYPGANGTDGPGITPDFCRTWAQAYAPDDPARWMDASSNKTLNDNESRLH